MTVKVIRIGSAEIQLDAYVTAATALLGTKGAGKTYTAKGIAEQLLDYNIPIIVFDAIGMWRWLKVPADAKGRGFEVVIAGGVSADLPLTPASAQEIVRAAMRENIPLVLDFYDKRMSKSDWRKIVQTCFRTLLYENEGLRHLFLEETPEFAPQKILDGETYAEVEKLARMGGNASLGITLIGQRAQEINKAVLDLCDNLVLLKQRGSHAIDNLEKWIDRLAPASAKAVAASLPNLKAGEAWVFAADFEEPERVRGDAINSFHPDRKKPQLAEKAGKPADAGRFVARLSGELATVIEQAKANDPSNLKAQPTLAVIAGVSPSSSAYQNNLGGLRSSGLIAYLPTGEVEFTADGRSIAREPRGDGRALHEHWLDVVTRPQRAILEQLIDAHPAPLTKDDLAERANVSPASSAYQNNLGRLRSLGAIDYPRSGIVELTKAVMP